MDKPKLPSATRIWSTACQAVSNVVLLSPSAPPVSPAPSSALTSAISWWAAEGCPILFSAMAATTTDMFTSPSSCKLCASTFCFSRRCIKALMVSSVISPPCALRQANARACVRTLPRVRVCVLVCARVDHVCVHVCVRACECVLACVHACDSPEKERLVLPSTCYLVRVLQGRISRVYNPQAPVA